MENRNIPLFRPVGLYELQKIGALGWNTFPPRLPEQPIFYPVTNRAYAIQIARDWNTRDFHSGYCGFVTSFFVEAGYLRQFQTQQVGAQVHQEYWIPAERLAEFNRHIIGGIQLEAAFYGALYTGSRFEVPGQTEDLKAALNQSEPGKELSV